MAPVRVKLEFTDEFLIRIFSRSKPTHSSGERPNQAAKGLETSRILSVLSVINVNLGVI